MKCIQSRGAVSYCSGDAQAKYLPQGEYEQHRRLPSGLQGLGQYDIYMRESEYCTSGSQRVAHK